MSNVVQIGLISRLCPSPGMTIVRRPDPYLEIDPVSDVLADKTRQSHILHGQAWLRYPFCLEASCIYMPSVIIAQSHIAHSF